MYKRVIEKVQESPFEAFLIQHEYNRNFLCNKGNYFLPGVLLITESEVYLATPSRNINYFKTLYSEYHVLAGGLTTLVDVCHKKGLKTIGYEQTTITMNQYTTMQTLFKDCELISAPNFMEQIRMVKTPEEIHLLQEAATLSDKAYLEFLNHLKVGITEKEARVTFDHILMSLGADEFSFPTLLSSGERSFMPHSAPTDKVIQSGDLVLMDYGIILNGYCSDTSRTVVMGHADERQKALYDLVLRAQLHALDHITAGITCQEADAYARDYIQAELHQSCFDYGLGHGIGMEVHEDPRFRPQNDFILLPNTAMSVEPGIYIEGWGGIRIEDIMIVEAHKGGRNLTTAPKMELIELTNRIY